MCGIVGIIGRGAVSGRMVDALRRLEYRGYDSAGLATLVDGRLELRRSEGKLPNLQLKLVRSPLDGDIGIGHTRWATHGPATERNAHPHATARLAVVHNGIVENFRELRSHMEGLGTRFETDTDTEVVAHLVSRAMDNGMDPVSAVTACIPRLKGAFALCFMFSGERDLLVVARHGAPLAIGYSEGETYVGSDADSLSLLTREVSYLDEGDWAVLTRDGADIRDRDGHPVRRARHRIESHAGVVGKGGHRHFMAKEIHEQPEVVGRTLTHYADLAHGRIHLPMAAHVDFRTWRASPSRPAGLLTTPAWSGGTGSSASLASTSTSTWLPSSDNGGPCRSIGPLPRHLTVRRDRRYPCRAAPCRGGRPAHARHRQRTRLDHDPRGMGRRAEPGWPGDRGRLNQGLRLPDDSPLVLAVAAGRARGMLDGAGERRLVDAMAGIPALMAEAARRCEPVVEALAREIAQAQNVVFVGRGPSYPLALEGALKLKETSYINAQGYAAGEMKHGPIAQIDGSVPVIAIAPPDELYGKTMSNVHEIEARGGRIVLISGASETAAPGTERFATVAMPDVDPILAPMIYAVPLQLLAYHVAAALGKDVDQPRNLAKCVTVE